MSDEAVGLKEEFDLDNSLKSLAIINHLLHVIDDMAYSDDLCIGPWKEEIEQAKTFLAQHNVHEKYCFDCACNTCYGCNKEEMWREIRNEHV